jgi:hypothetical protein
MASKRRKRNSLFPASIRSALHRPVLLQPKLLAVSLQLLQLLLGQHLLPPRLQLKPPAGIRVRWLTFRKMKSLSEAIFRGRALFTQLLLI